MLKYTIFVALVALSLQAEARNIVVREVEDNEVDQVPEFKVKAPWHGHADEGYPGFDGNPFKQSLVEMSSLLAHLAADALEGEKDVPPVVMSIVKGAQKTNWESFDEYLDFWGAAQNALVASIESEEQHSSLPEIIRKVQSQSNEDDDDDNDTNTDVVNNDDEEDSYEEA